VDIQNLRAAPQFRAQVADRIWRAWWEPHGASVEDVQHALGEVLESPGFPFTLVATEYGQFIGTVTAIVSDMAERPELSPWIAALWVEPDWRGQGVARALLDHAAHLLAGFGHATAYLCARPSLRPFYSGLDWRLIEENAGPHGLDIFVRHQPISVRLGPSP
jgi:predicted N-acetyltransferase YhbS